jgi:hypothetical protein
MTVRSSLMLLRGINKLGRSIANMTIWLAKFPVKMFIGSLRLAIKGLDKLISLPAKLASGVFKGITGITKSITSAPGKMKDWLTKPKEAKTGASLLETQQRKEKQKTGIEGELQKIRFSIERFDTVYQNNLEKSAAARKNASDSIKDSWKKMTNQWQTLKINQKKHLEVAKDSGKIMVATLKDTKAMKGALKDSLGVLKEIKKKGSSMMQTIMLIASSLFSMIKGLFTSAKNLATGASLAKAAGGIAGGAGAGGAAGKRKPKGRFGRGVARIGGSLAKMGGGILSAGMMGMDAFSGVGMANQWGTSKTSAGIGGALGGTESGASGAMSGVIKGAALGMMFGPIGAGLGALAGGLLGFVGGENIAKGLDWIWDKVKNVTSAVTDVLMYPFKILEKLKDKFMDWFKNPEKTLFEKVTEIGKQLMNVISWPARMIMGIGTNILQTLYDLIPNAVKKFIPDFILSGITGTLSTFKSISQGFDTSGGVATEKSSTASSISRSAVTAKENTPVSEIPSYETGGIVPPAPGGGLDGRGGQFAIVHEGEEIIPRNLVKSAQSAKEVPKEIKQGSTFADHVASVLESYIPQGLSDAASNIMGKLKLGYEKIKESLGPSSGFGWLSRMFESAGAGPSALCSVCWRIPSI